MSPGYSQNQEQGFLGGKGVALNPRVTSELSPFPVLGSSGISPRELLDTVRFKLLDIVAAGDGDQGTGLCLPWDGSGVAGVH